MKRTLLVLALSSGCGGPPATRAEAPPLAPPVIPIEVPIGAPEVCVVDAAGADTVALRVTADGLLLGRGGALIRLAGAGCDLTEVPGRYAMEGADIDVDDLGRAYVMPERSSDPAVIETQTDFNAGVVRIDASGHIEPLVSRGRWIAGFSIGRAGDELTLYGCAATGLHRETPSGFEMDQAASQRAIEAGGLDDSSVAMGGGVIIMAKSGALLRVTAEGQASIGRSDVVFGGPQISRCGPEPQPARALVRCGDGVCGLFADGVAMWTADGELTRIVSRDHIEIEDDETFEQVGGDARGVYLLVRGTTATRVVFVPAALSQQL